MVKRLIPNSDPLIYLITDRSRLAQSSCALSALVSFLDRAFEAGVDMVQIRERDLSAKDLFLLARRVNRSAIEHKARLLINDRADVAAAAGAGVHLTTRSMRADAVRRAFGEDMLIGVSTHGMKEALEAEIGGADFIVFGPVFETESKKSYGPPVGLDALTEVASRLKIPVIALGGINLDNFRSTLDCGAAGVAAISMFADAEDLKAVVQKIKNGKIRSEQKSRRRTK
ncbi:MAG: thiamine phosphate synthase [Acidobacteriota bacterium]